MSKFKTTGKRIQQEDDVVRVYNEKNQVVYEGIYDYCPYKYDESWFKDGYYDLKNGGYRMVCL